MGRWPHTAAAAPGHAPLSLVGMSIRGWPQPGALPTSGAACDPAQGRAASCAAPPHPHPHPCVLGGRRGDRPHPLCCPVRGCGRGRVTKEGPTFGMDIGARPSPPAAEGTRRVGATMGPGNGAGGTQSHREWDVGTGTQRRAESGGWGGRRDGGEGGCGDTRGRAPGCGAARRADVMRGDSRPNEGLLAGGDGPAAPGPVNKLSRAALMGPGAGRHQGRARAGNEAASRPRAAHGAHRSAAGAGMRCGRAWGGRAATSRHGSARAVQHTRGSAPGFGRAAPSAPPPHRHAVPVGRSPVRFNRFIPSQTPFGARRRRRPRRSHSRSTWKAFPCCCSSRWCCRRSSCRSPRSASRRSCGDGCEPTAAQRGGPGAPRGRPGGTHRHQLLAGEAQLRRQAPA